VLCYRQERKEEEMLRDWAYKHKRLASLLGLAAKCEVSDPVNLFFVDASLNEIDRTLLSAKWHRPGATGGTLFLDPACSRPQDSQWTDSSVWRRFHIRLWQEGTNVIGSAHYETLRGFHRHEVHHFEGAEDKVASLFENLGWKVISKSRKLQNPEYERYNDGFCTEIAK